ARREFHAVVERQQPRDLVFEDRTFKNYKDLQARGHLPDETTPVGDSFGRLTHEAAEAQGLTVDCTVSAGMIDA
ncbi:hypothetical protein ACCT11_36345, partial [Rhizobium johnstonii]|uniref:hypothetical protein n=1 Tax=Rhizobium johnstonii TaxID=3019933 RepID=UPI003F9D36EC